MYEGIIAAYSRFLPVSAATPRISLGEGRTPLLRAVNIEKQLPGVEVYLKYEGLNPTGSFKDRGMTMAVSKAVEEGSQAVICASTGNTSASAAAYAARAGLKAFVLIPDSKIALGKLAQAMAYGAEILPINGNFDAALQIVRELAAAHPVTLVNSVNPYRIEGQKSAAFEVVDALGEAPDFLFIPVGNAGNITAYWKGFQEYQAAGCCSRRPRLFGYQAEGAAPLVAGHPIAEPETIATAIRIGNPASWKQAEAALAASGGQIDTRSDADILAAYKLLAAAEGVFAEPASCISVAGLLKAYAENKVPPGSRIVCVLTGHGLKDPDIAVSQSPQIPVLEGSYTALERALEMGLAT